MKLSELAREIGGVLDGADVEITGVSNLDVQAPGTIAYVEDKRKLAVFADSPVSALIVGRDVEYAGKPVVRVDDVKLAFAKLLGLFDTNGKYAHGVYPAAHVDITAKIGKHVTVMPFASIMENASVGDDTVIYSNVFIGRNVKIGTGCVIKAGAAVMDNCVVGDRCILHPNCVIGGDGFGYTPVNGRQVKIPQIGRVVLEDDVEVGACSTIDRATIGDTVIGSGVKIDNLVQVAHNCRIGENTILVSQVGIGGSTTVGKNCILAGQVGVTDHAGIGDNVVVLAKTGIDSKHVESGKVLFGIPARDVMTAKRIYAAEERLPELVKTVRGLTKEKNNE